MKRIIAVAVAALATIGLMGCANETKTVTLIAHDSFVMSDTLVKSFEETYKTKLVIVRAGDAGAMTNKLVLTKEAPLADVVFGIDNTFAPIAKKNKIIDGELTPIDFADVCFNVDLNYFKSHNLVIPSNWRDLTKSEYKNLTVIENPNTSSTGLAFLTSTYAGFPPMTAGVIPPTVNWWLALRDNGVKLRLAGRTLTTQTSVVLLERANTRLYFHTLRPLPMKWQLMELVTLKHCSKTASDKLNTLEC